MSGGSSGSKRAVNDQDGQNSSKKLRFDYRNPSTLAAEESDEDEILELDEIGKSTSTKRSAVNLDGLDSDSDNDNFNTRAAARAKAQAQRKEDDDDDDMFADLAEDDDDNEEFQVKKKKVVRFLNEDDIEGQVLSSTSGGHVPDIRQSRNKATTTITSRNDEDHDDDEEDGQDETSSESGGDEGRDWVGSDVDEELGAGAKKKHAPRLDAFNMRAEVEEGRFDESGNFVRTAVDPNAVHDNWLEGLSKKDIKRARDAESKREEARREKDMIDDAILTSDLLSSLIANLHRGETALEALQRLAKAKSKQPKTSKWQRTKRQNGDAMDAQANDPAYDDDAAAAAAAAAAAEARRKAAVEAITAAADGLLTRGQEDVYDAERELLTRQYKRETGDDWIDPKPASPEMDDPDPNPSQWEYRWADARDGGQHHGPYDSQTMRAWNEAGYFGQGVEYRKVGTAADWSMSADFLR